MGQENSERDYIALKLIEMLGWSLRQLNDGTHHLPKHWQEHLKKAAGFKNRGRPSSPEVQAERQKIAAEKLQHDLAYQRGEVTKTPSSFAEELATSYGYDRADIFKWSKEYRSTAIAEEITRRLNEKDNQAHMERAERVKTLNARLTAGENYDDIMFDPALETAAFSIMWRNKNTAHIPEPEPAPAISNHDRVLGWLSDGLNRGIRDAVSDYETFEIVDKDILSLVQKKK